VHEDGVFTKESTDKDMENCKWFNNRKERVAQFEQGEQPADGKEEVSEVIPPGQAFTPRKPGETSIEASNS
jgi:hypothetical protein